MLDRPGALAVVAKDAAATDLQSFIVIQVAADESEILSIATAPTARRAGLARAADRASGRESRGKPRQCDVFGGCGRQFCRARAVSQLRVHGAWATARLLYTQPGNRPVDALMLRATLPLESAMGMARRLD